MTAANYITLKEKRLNILFRIINGCGFYLINGETIHPEEFEKLFPLPLYVRPESKYYKGKNSDTTRDFLYDD